MDQVDPLPLIVGFVVHFDSCTLRVPVRACACARKGGCGGSVCVGVTVNGVCVGVTVSGVRVLRAWVPFLESLEDVIGERGRERHDVPDRGIHEARGHHREEVVDL